MGRPTPSSPAARPYRRLLRVLRGGSLVLAGVLLGVLIVVLNLPPYRTIRRLPAVQKLVPKARTLVGSLPQTVRFHPSRDSEVSATERERLEKARALASLAYAGGVTPKTEKSGVTAYQPALSHAGLNLCIDGHKPEALLLDMEGRVRHRWSMPFETAFPGLSPQRADSDGTLYWRHVQLLPDGSLLAIYEGQGLIKLDRDSGLVWAFPGAAHHDLDITGDGTIYVLTRTAEMVPRVNRDEPVLHDFITVLTPEGKEIRRVSLLSAIERSDHSALLKLSAREKDLFHTNSLQILDSTLAEEIPAFAAGRLLISMATNNSVAVLDLAEERVVWAMAGSWFYQHQPTLLPNGNLMVFDNQGDHGRSRVIELDPRTQDLVWAYRDSEHGFFSRYCGMFQRLPNGNTLIVETDYGRAFEVTPDRKIVWEYYTPYRAGKAGELVAALFEVHRIEPATVAWLDGKTVH